MDDAQNVIDALGLQGRESQFLSKVLELSQAAVLITDPSGTIEYVNRAFERMTGYATSEVVGRTPRILKSGRTDPSLYEDLWSTITSGETWKGRIQNRRKDGSLYWEEVTISSLCGADGGILHFVAVMDNIARELKTERQYRMLFEGMLNGFAVHEIICDASGRPVDYRFLDVNPAFERMTGLPAKEIVGRTIREIMPGTEPFWIERYGEVALSGRAIQFEEFSSVLGRRFHVTAYRPEPGRFAAVLDDITERHNMQVELLGRETEFRLLLENLSAGVVVHAPNSAIVLANTMASTLLGLTNDQMLGKTAMDPDWCFLSDDGTPMPVEQYPVERVLASGQPIRSQVVGINRPDRAEPNWVVCNAYPEQNANGTLARIVVTFTDITECKRSEHALLETNHQLEAARARAEELAVKADAAARAKSEFLAVMSHELRTPLNGVLGFAELLADTKLDQEQQGYTATIRESGSHLLNVVNDILDYSSIEKGKLIIESAPVEVAGLLESACQPILKAASDKGLDFSCEEAPGLPETIVGDIRRLRQILINLLGNAVKFTSRGSVVLRVEPGLISAAPAIRFSITDTGPGIPPGMLGVLFSPFIQADSTLCRQFEGNGLGLAISKRLADAMGGSITVSSTPGEGSTFTFIMPVGSPQPLPPAGLVEPDSFPRPVLSQRSGGLILLVEDDRVSALLASRMLASLGYRSECAGDGLEAVNIFSPGKYAAILMDMQMPVMDGIEATRGIRRMESGSGVRVPIIALTANVMPGDRELCLAAGMDDFLSKPFKKAEISAKLIRYCARGSVPPG